MMREPGAVTKYRGYSRSKNISWLDMMAVNFIVAVTALKLGSRNCNPNMLETGCF